MRDPIRMLLAAATVMSSIAVSQQSIADPDSGSVLEAKFAPVFAQQKNSALCNDLLQSLNQPTLYDANDPYVSLLTTDKARLWQIVDPVRHQIRPARTAGEYHWTMNRTEFVQADLDHDGTDEDVYRTWLELKGQPHTQLSLDADGESQPISWQSLSSALQRIGQPSADSSFFLIEVVELQSAAYLLALETIDPGVDRHNRLAYVLHLAETRKPEIDCIFKTTMFKD